MEQNDNKNLYIAVALSGLVLLVWAVLFPPAEAPIDPIAVTPSSVTATTDANGTPTTPPAANAAASAPAAITAQQADLESAPRITIDTPSVEGSITLLGGRIDDLKLKKYRETLEDNSPIVTLLTPYGSEKPYYAFYGWAPAGTLSGEDVPTANTLWALESGSTLSVDNPVTLRWENTKGLIFRRTIAIDADYMFTVTQSIENTGTAAQRAQPYGIVARFGKPDTIGFYISHEGVVRMIDGKLTEIKYKKMPDLDVVEGEAGRTELAKAETEGWIGFASKEWMANMVSNGPFTSAVKYDTRNDIYQVESRQPTQDIPAGATVSVKTRLFAGAKDWSTLHMYETEQDVTGFINSIDWGMFFFITKPMFWLLHTLEGLIGNMGWSIVALTFIVKAIFFPLAYKSYSSMAKMKMLQPEMEAIKERCGDDKQKQQKEIMELYKKEKVNPASGCLPILLQIPIFFSLYKVVFVTLDLRHAPWLGWIRDLSAPDPSSILNLFGLLPFAAPDPGSMLAIVSLGLLPILLGISMWFQQKLNPTPTDATQAMIFAWMPWVFMFMLGRFASGLVLYWITNNTLTFIQQYLIMTKQGAKPDVFGNIKASFKRKKADKD